MLPPFPGIGTVSSVLFIQSGEKGVVLIAAELGAFLHTCALGQISVSGLQPNLDQILLDGKTGLRFEDPGEIAPIQIQLPCDGFHTQRAHIVTADQILHLFRMGALLYLGEEGSV